MDQPRMRSDPAYWRIMNAIATDIPINREKHARTIWLRVQRATKTIRGPKR
jgi:hypothetical protein